MSESPSPLSPVMKMIVEAGFATLYLGALVFIAGWSYADRFFAELGLNISAIDGLETSSFSAYALWVFRDAVLSVVAILITVLVAGFLFRHALGSVREHLVAAVAVALAVLSLFGAGYLGSERARLQVATLFTEDYKSLVRVSVLPKTGSMLAQYLNERPGLSDNGCLRKIFMDQKHLYAYAGYATEKGPNQQILIIPLSEVALIETLTIPDLCTL